MSEPQFEVPEGWTAIKRAIIGTRHFPDAGRVTHVIGWQVRRDACGCELLLGMRMDKHEPTSGLAPCAAHGQECTLVMHALKTMEPSDTPLVQLTTSMLDEALA